jgi:glycosyltransferase involved in cell wall biosynthesis
LISFPALKRRILYIGDPSPGETSFYRQESLRRLGQEVEVFNVRSYAPRSSLLGAVAYRYPLGPIIARINRDILLKVRAWKPDVVFFDKATQFTPQTVRSIKAAGALTVSYNQDSPFGPRADPGWQQYLRVYRLFDLHCLFRDSDVKRYAEAGLPFIRTMFSFEPSMQFPPPDGWGDSQRTREVSYIGSPHEDRPAFLRSLAEDQHLPIVIAGPRWRKFFSPDLLKRYVSDGYLADADYRTAIWKSKINLGFISHLNEDDIGHKCIEIAACGCFLLATRSDGHSACFEEDKEAVFFSSVEECADKARFYLDRSDLREAIGRRARERAVRSGYDNDTQLARILHHLDGSQE